MKNKILSILLITVNALVVPLYFMEWIVGIGHLPCPDGGIEERRFYHSPAENLTDMECGGVMYISIALIAAAVVLSCISLVKKDRQRLSKASLIVSVISVLMAAASMLLSTTVGRGY